MICGLNKKFSRIKITSTDLVITIMSLFSAAAGNRSATLGMADNDAYHLMPNPNKSIGCQALLEDGTCTHSGWLRRQSLRTRFKIFSWPQVYVVICGGCVYCYSSEVANKPASAFSLYGYDRVVRAGEVTEKEAPWTFKLEHNNFTYRTYFFSSSSKKEMTQWMKHMKQEMLRASGKLARTAGDGNSFGKKKKTSNASASATYIDAATLDSGGSFSSEDYHEIESNIYEDCEAWARPSNYTNKKEDEASDDEMEDLVMSRPDLQERPPQPPPVPQRPEKQQRGAAATPQADAVVEQLKNIKLAPKAKRTPSSSDVQSTETSSDPEPKEENAKQMRSRGEPDGSSGKKKQQEEAGDFWSTIYFYGGKEMATEIIRKLADEGTYLVRVNDDKSMVLHIYATGLAKKFQIFKEGDMYTLKKNSGADFKRVEELIYHYYTNTLPSLDVSLEECYRQHPDFKSLTLS